MSAGVNDKQDKSQIHQRLVERLRRHALDVVRMTRGLDERALSARSEQDSWSLKELVAHMRRVQQVFASRIETMLAQDNPALPSYSPDKDTEMRSMVDAEGQMLVEVFLRERQQ
jgi:hypothetical protein